VTSLPLLLFCCCWWTFLHACLPYRVLLPINFESVRGVVIGEGKPENQNHAVVFCPGEALQTIDCNQDNIVAEGLKLRNLLAELLPEDWDTAHLSTKPTLTQTIRQGTQRLLGVQGGGSSGGGAAAAAAGQGDSAKMLRQVPQGKGRVALVGFREWIFSEDSGALAEFAAATERSFGTTVQRLMHNPGEQI
jgi:callose synthase